MLKTEIKMDIRKGIDDSEWDECTYFQVSLDAFEDSLRDCGGVCRGQWSGQCHCIPVLGTSSLQRQTQSASKQLRELIKLIYIFIFCIMVTQLKCTQLSDNVYCLCVN